MKKVEVNIWANVNPAQVIAAFTNPELLQEWWGVEKCLIQTSPGGIYSLVWNVTDQSMGFVFSGIVQEYVPEHTLKISDIVYLNPQRSILGPMNLTVIAREEGSGSRIYLCQDGYREGGDWDWYYQAVNDAWPIVMKDFKAYIEKKFQT